MASLATFVNRFVGVRALEGVQPAVWPREESPRLRPLANEDVYFFVKRIDNSGVIRAVDPAARRACSRSVVTGFCAALLIIAGLAPAAYNTMAGFTLQHLRGQQQSLKQEEAVLNLREAKLLSPARLEKLAASLNMVNPQPQQIQQLTGGLTGAPPATTEARVILPH